MADGKTTEPTKPDRRLDGATDTNGRVKGGEGLPRGAETARRRNIFGKARTLAASQPWHRPALAAVLILSAFLNLLWLPTEGYANTYYAATVKNMLTSWSNFFFASFDAGFVTVDKPPLGLWVQAASAYLFGLNGLSLVLPQAIAGVLSVALIYDGMPKGGPPGGGPPGGPGGSANPELVEYLRANNGDVRYLVAVSSAMSASPLILNTDEPVISLGGYNGIDPVFTADELAGLVDEGAIRFFLMPDREAIEEMMAEREANGDGPPPGSPRGGPGPGGPGGGLPQNGSAEWIEDNCVKVPQELWQSSPDSERGGGGPPMMRARALFDCGAGGS